MGATPTEKGLFAVGRVNVSVDNSGIISKFLLTEGTEAERERVAIYLLVEGFLAKDSVVEF